MGRRDRVLGFALLWIAALLVPLVDLVPRGNTPVAVHYLYLPGVGLALFVVRAAQHMTEVLQRTRIPHAAFAAAATPVLLVAVWQPELWTTVAAWSDAEMLYSATVRNYPDNIEARANLSAVYLNRERYAQADRLLSESLRLSPHDPALIRNRFELLWRTRRAKEALAFLDAHPSLSAPPYLIQRGKLLEQLDRHAQAAAALESALETATEPRDRLAAGYHLVTVLVRLHRRREAIQLTERLLEEFPGRKELLIAKRLLTP